MLDKKSILIIAACFASIHIVVTFSAHALFQGSASHQSAWEYKIHKVISEEEIAKSYRLASKEEDVIQIKKFRSDSIKELEDMGRNGWEIYWVTEKEKLTGIAKQIFYLKRPL